MVNENIEWDGKGIPPTGTRCNILSVDGDDVIGIGVVYHVDGSKVLILSSNLDNYPEESTVLNFDGSLNLYVMWVYAGDIRFSKIETEAERLERERLEAAYDLYCLYTNTDTIDATCLSFHCFNDSSIRVKWLTIVDKTGHRK